MENIELQEPLMEFNIPREVGVRPQQIDVSISEEQKEDPPLITWTSKKIKILISVIYGNLFLGSCYSLMAPIFPAEAEKKKASPTAYGLVFGVYQLIMFLSAPFYGKFMPSLKPGFLMKTGMLVSGVCVILFGLLDYCPAGPIFIAIAIFIRMIDAFGASAFLTASYTTLGCELPDIIGRAMSITETAFALGLAGGPVIGGLLYQAGGFYLPFFVVGSLLLAGTAVNFFLFTDDDKEIPPRTITLKELLSDYDFLIDILAVSTCFAVLGFNEASLEPHLRQFNLSPSVKGLIFLISGITDALISPVWGYFAEKVPNAHHLTLLGTLMFIISFLIVGPVSFLPFAINLWVVLLSQFLLGLGMGGEIVCSFTHGMKHTVERGFPNAVGTNSMVSGVLFAASCFGAFIGPSLGGLMIDQFSYIKATEAVVIMKTCVALICALRIIFRHKEKKKMSKT